LIAYPPAGRALRCGLDCRQFAGRDHLQAGTGATERLGPDLVAIRR
jgi:hypothetical protein